MDKKILLEEIRELFYVGADLDKLGHCNNVLEEVVLLVERLDEPEVPSVPQFVSDWFEHNKNDLDFAIYQLGEKYNKGVLDEDMERWYGNYQDKPIEKLILMQYGYTVQEEKLYFMPVPFAAEGLYYMKTFDGELCVRVTTGNKDFCKFTKEELTKHFPGMEDKSVEVSDENS